MSTTFNLANFKKQYKPQDPSYMKLISRPKYLGNLQLQNCGLKKNDAEFLTLALDPNRVDFASHIKILNLSKNLFYKDGSKIFN